MRTNIEDVRKWLGSVRTVTGNKYQHDLNNPVYQNILLYFSHIERVAFGWLVNYQSYPHAQPEFIDIMIIINFDYQKAREYQHKVYPIHGEPKWYLKPISCLKFYITNGLMPPPPRQSTSISSQHHAIAAHEVMKQSMQCLMDCRARKLARNDGNKNTKFVSRYCYNFT